MGVSLFDEYLCSFDSALSDGHNFDFRRRPEVAEIDNEFRPIGYHDIGQRHRLCVEIDEDFAFALG